MANMLILEGYVDASRQHAFKSGTSQYGPWAKFSLGMARAKKNDSDPTKYDNIDCFVSGDSVQALIEMFNKNPKRRIMVRGAIRSEIKEDNGQKTYLPHTCRVHQWAVVPPKSQGNQQQQPPQQQPAPGAYGGQQQAPPPQHQHQPSPQQQMQQGFGPPGGLAQPQPQHSQQQGFGPPPVGDDDLPF